MARLYKSGCNINPFSLYCLIMATRDEPLPPLPRGSRLPKKPSSPSAHTQPAAKTSRVQVDSEAGDPARKPVDPRDRAPSSGGQAAIPRVDSLGSGDFCPRCGSVGAGGSKRASLLGAAPSSALQASCIATHAGEASLAFEVHCGFHVC